ncbi:universal stress protein [Planococcus sp. APC 4015]|nr:universal stress protein [Planococcus sp. APC 4015]
MVESIIVGFDGSDASFVALDWVGERAARGRARVEIVMIGGTIFSDTTRANPSIHNAESRLRSRAPDAEIASRQFPGRLPESLLEHASAADLLVIGSHLRRSIRSALTGRLPLKICIASPIPVVIVPDQWTAVDGPVVVGLDEDESSDAALQVAASEAAAVADTLVVVHAWQMPPPRMEGAVALLASPIQEKAVQRSILRESVLALSRSHPDVQVEQVLVQESPTTALLEHARDASLLVLGTHHRSLFAGALLGSVGQGVLAHARIPVCIVPSRTGTKA